MTRLLYHHDSYQQEMDASIVESTPGTIILDQTIFYPTGGGQPCDTGTMVINGANHEVSEVKKDQGKILHLLKDTTAVFTPNTKVHGIINWNRRYQLMKHHTACHLLSAVVHQTTGALITGNQLGEDNSRIDFSLEQFDRNYIQSLVDQANALLKKNAEVKVYWLPREDAMKQPGMVKLAMELPESLKELRIVEITGIDTQADGGTHVHNLSEIGQLEIVKLENKGSQRRRLYFKLK